MRKKGDGALAAARSTRLTGRAALLAVVICAIALSLAYPVREYIAQRQQIDQLLAQQQTMSAQVQGADSRRTPSWGRPGTSSSRPRTSCTCASREEQCYEVISGQPPRHGQHRETAAAADPWYAKLWQSVQRADAQPAR